MQKLEKKQEQIYDRHKPLLHPLAAIPRPVVLALSISDSPKAADVAENILQ